MAARDAPLRSATGFASRPWLWPSYTTTRDTTHGISRLPETDGDKPARKRFNAYPIGYFHIDIAEVTTEQGKLHLFVAIDRTSKFAFVQLQGRATTRITSPRFAGVLRTAQVRISMDGRGR